MDDKKSIKEMVNNAKNNIEMLLKNTSFPAEIKYKKDDKIVSSTFEILKLAKEGRLIFFKKEEIDKIAKHMRTQPYNKQDWKLLQNDFRAKLYLWYRREIIRMSEVDDNSFYGAVLFNAQQDNQDNIEFTWKMLSKKAYEEIMEEATTLQTEQLQEIFNKVPQEYVEQISQIPPDTLKEIIDELKKTYEIDEETGTIRKGISV